jgi:tRNA (5-methylaminomethyl-2-thiouridylate)-methyltransferase
VSLYFDHNATTPMRAEVADAISAALRDLPGNPSSVHAVGRAARAAIEAARVEVAALVAATPEEIVFCSGGTEGNALALAGLLRGIRNARGAGQGRLHVVSSPLEHPSVLGALEQARAELDVEMSWVSVAADGAITPAALAAAMRPDTALVTLALANHEIGNLYDVAALAAVARTTGARFHADAVAAAGKVVVDVRALGVDALTLSAHKIGGPKGTGAIYIKRQAPFAPVAGGHQERERRPGTENVPGIVGFGVAAGVARGETEIEAARVAALRDRLEARLLAIPGARRHGGSEARLPGTVNVGFDGAPGPLVAVALDLEGVSVSNGAACTSGSVSPSAVVQALGLPAAKAAEAIRFGIGRGNEAADVDRAAELTEAIVARVRAEALAGPTMSGSRERVVIAMSGGVDSSTAAALLVEAGYEVIGVTLRLTDARGTDASIGGRCCGPRDIEDARVTAQHLGIAHYVLDESEAFRAFVIDDFVAEHRAGRTPNPCVRCNERLKFGPLLAFARAIGARALATGHYARIEAGPEGPVLGRARDRDKDQSYFLFGVRNEMLARVRFPLGDKTKEEVREIARRFRLPNADKPDSHEICFIPDGDHVGFLEARGGQGRPGAVVDAATGDHIGDHAGTHTFTIGQRRGVPGGGKQPRFVLRIDAGTGTVHVGPRDQLGRDSLSVADVRWLDAAAAEKPVRCSVQIRHHAAALPAWIEPDPDGGTRVRLDQPAYGVAPGQAAVFYAADDRVLGGGWIR